MKRSICLILAMLTVTVVLGVWSCFIPRTPRLMLPETASNVHEFDSSGILAVQSDYYYLLTARITPEKFNTYVQNMGMEKTQQPVDWWPGINDSEWWNPEASSRETTPTYATQRGNKFAKYENGRLFYKESSGY